MVKKITGSYTILNVEEMLIENFLIDFSISQLKGGVFYLKNSDVNMRNIPANQATSGGEGGFIYFLKGKELY